MRVDGLDADLLATVRGMPQVADADLLAHAYGRTRAGKDRLRPLLLFLRGDTLPTLSTFEIRDGEWPPRGNGVLIERSARRVLGADDGANFEAIFGNAQTVTLRNAGTVHDAAQAPASQEGMVYACTTFANAAALGIAVKPEWLLLRCDGAADVETIRAPARSASRNG